MVTMFNPGTVLSLLHGMVLCYSITDLIKDQLQDRTLGVILSTYPRISKETRDTQCIFWYTRGLLSLSFKFIKFYKSEESASQGVNSQLLPIKKISMNLYGFTLIKA